MLGNHDVDVLDVLNKWLKPTNSFFIHENMTAEMRSIISELQLPPASKPLQQLFYHTRILQLIYLLMDVFGSPLFDVL